MNEPKKKIQILNVDLDINLEDEIKKHSIIDANTKNKINTILDTNKPVKKINPTEQLWTDKFDKLFNIMSNQDTNVTKSDMVKILEIPPLELAPAISRYKKFLRVNKLDQWTILTGQNNKRERIYTLKKL